MVEFRAAFAAKLAAEPYFSDAERREIREMLAYYRIARPQFEAMKSGCPTARMILDE